MIASSLIEPPRTVSAKQISFSSSEVGCGPSDVGAEAADATRNPATCHNAIAIKVSPARRSRKERKDLKEKRNRATGRKLMKQISLRSLRLCGYLRSRCQLAGSPWPWVNPCSATGIQGKEVRR